MSEDTSIRRLKDIISANLPHFESRHEIFDYLLNTALKLDAENRELVLRGIYAPIAGIAHLDREAQDAALAKNKAYMAKRAEMQAAHAELAGFLRRHLDEARGESVRRLDEKLRELSAREGDAADAKKKYGNELERLREYEGRLDKRAKEIEQQGAQLARDRARLDEDKKSFQARAAELIAHERDYAARFRELEQVLPYAREFYSRLQDKAKGFYTGLAEMIEFLTGTLQRLKPIQMPDAPHDETLLDIDKPEKP